MKMIIVERHDTTPCCQHRALNFKRGQFHSTAPHVHRGASYPFHVFLSPSLLHLEFVVTWLCPTHICKWNNLQILINFCLFKYVPIYVFFSFLIKLTFVYLLYYVIGLKYIYIHQQSQWLKSPIINHFLVKFILLIIFFHLQNLNLRFYLRNSNLILLKSTISYVC